MNSDDKPLREDLDDADEIIVVAYERDHDLKSNIIFLKVMTYTISHYQELYNCN